MKKKALKLLSIFSLITGLILFIVSTSGITGLAVSEGILKKSSSILSIFFIVCSLILILIERESEGGLVKLIKETVPKADETNCEILIDADFAKFIDDEKKDLPNDLPTDFFGNYPSVIPQTVYHEMTRQSQQTMQPLVSRKTINHLEKNLKTTFANFNPSGQEINTIYDLWLKNTPQGRKANEREKDRFWEGGDMALLCYALQRGQDYTIILSNNYSEIGKIAEKLRERNLANVYVMTTENVFGYVPAHSGRRR